MNFLDFSLGRDFWNFRMGQLISLLGDSCSHIALAWWILDKSGSAVAMSSVLAPAMVIRIALLPLLGPIGDRYCRKKLIMISDFWRFVCSALLCAMIFFDYYNLSLLVFIFSLSAVGSALFSAVGGSIVPQIVAREKLQLAMQQTQAINSFAGVIGGILGGVIVSLISVFGAFLFDTFSYLIAFICTSLIKANTLPREREQKTNTSAITQWKNEMLQGFAILYKIPVLFWICLVAMFMNLCLSPLGVVLPVLTKQSRGMPPWFLGALESSISLGAILGAVTLTSMQKYFKAHWLLFFSIMMMGLGIVLLPWVPNIFLPLTVLFWIGIGGSWANIPMGTQISLSLPDSFRARIGSLMGFMCNGVSPLGVAGAGLLIASLGLNHALIAMGLSFLFITPMLLKIPQIKEFLSATPEEAPQFFAKYYPGAFPKED